MANEHDVRVQDGVTQVGDDELDAVVGGAIITSTTRRPAGSSSGGGGGTTGGSGGTAGGYPVVDVVMTPTAPWSIPIPVPRL